MVVREELPSSSVTSRVTVFGPGSLQPTTGLLRLDSVEEKSEVRVMPPPSRFTPPSNCQLYSTIIPSLSVNISGISMGVRVNVSNESSKTSLGSLFSILMKIVCSTSCNPSLTVSVNV